MWNNNYVRIKCFSTFVWREKRKVNKNQWHNRRGSNIKWRFNLVNSPRGSTKRTSVFILDTSLQLGVHHVIIWSPNAAFSVWQLCHWTSLPENQTDLIIPIFTFTTVICNWTCVLNTLRPRQTGRHFADDTFKRIFCNVNVGISIKISMKFVHKGPINNIPALVQIMSWCRPGDKPLSEAMVVRLPTHICVTRPQWVESKS